MFETTTLVNDSWFWKKRRYEQTQFVPFLRSHPIYNFQKLRVNNHQDVGKHHHLARKNQDLYMYIVHIYIYNICMYIAARVATKRDPQFFGPHKDCPKVSQVQLFPFQGPHPFKNPGPQKTTLQERCNTPLEHTPENFPRQLWKESLQGLLVEV